MISLLFVSCSQHNVFKDIEPGSDLESAEDVLTKNRIKYKFYPAASFLDIDTENPEEIADAIINQSAGMLGEMLYKDALWYWQIIAGLKVESYIYFYDGVCSNIELKWHVKNTSNPSVLKGYAASEKLREYISLQFPDYKFEALEDEDRHYNEKYVMHISESLSIKVKGDEEKACCIIEDSNLQKPFLEFEAKVDSLVKEKGRKK